MVSFAHPRISPRRHIARALILALVVAAAMSASLVTPASADSAGAPAGTPRGTAATLATGSHFSCVLLEDGAVKCWGLGLYGQLGQGNISDLGHAPGQMGGNLPTVDLSRPAIAIATGSSHACALLDDHRLKCWGFNTDGRLGQGEPDSLGDQPGEMGDNLPAIELGTGRTATAITAGQNHTCALLDDHTVKCWGRNEDGQLGLGDDVTNQGDEAGEMGDNLPTVDLGTGRTATAIAASRRHTCALLDDHTVKCWGWNSSGELGQGDDDDRGDNDSEMGDNLPPIDLGAGRTATAIAAGSSHTCALLDNDTVKCWGSNSRGQLGQDDNDSRGDDPDEMGNNLPAIDLGTGRTATAITAGSAHTCAHLDNDTVKCWGHNSSGQLGQSDMEDRGNEPTEMGDFLAPIRVGTGRWVAAIQAGSIHTCVLLDNASIKCWGYNFFGSLGQGDTENRGDGPDEMGDDLAPVPLDNSRSVVSVDSAPATPVPPTPIASGDGSLRYSWPAPSDDGGSPITGYLMEASSDSGVTWAQVDTTPDPIETVNGLTNGTSYLLRVRAENAAGVSPPSLPSAAAVPGAATTTGTTCPTTSHGFTDVPASSFATADITCIVGLGITTGTSHTTYNPAGVVTREQMAAFVGRTVRALGGVCPTAPHPFTDVPASSFANMDIACIVGLDITTGTTATTYDPTGVVTREQMAAYIARTWRALGNICPTAPHPFTDVPTSSFATADIACIVGLDITTGTTATTYDPAGPVTREQMAAYIARTIRAS